MTKSALSQLFSFLKSPKNLFTNHKPKTKTSKIIWNVFQITCVSVVLAVASLLLSSAVSNLVGYDQNTDNQVVDQLTSNPLILSFALVVIVAPIIEEVAFRLFISQNKWVFVSGIGLLTIQFINFVYTILVSQIPSFQDNLTLVLILFTFYLAILICTILLGVLLPKNWVKSFTQKNIGHLIWFSIIFFGLVHLGNFANGISYFYLAPLLVAPQTIAGIGFVFARVRYNIWWAIIAHAVYNFILSFALFAYPIFGVRENVSEIVEGLNGGRVSFDPNLAVANTVLFFLYLSVICVAIYSVTRFLKELSFDKPVESKK